MINNITHLGGEHNVTGSCHLLQIKSLNILVDCGLTQGNDKAVPISKWPISADKIDFLFITHAHLDHIGRIPELIKNGFNGEIIATHATKALMEPMLKDALGFSEYTQHETDKILGTLESLSWGFEYNQSFSLKKGISFTLGRAGHILGSCWIQFELPDGKSIVFSGDLGAKNAPILPDPDIPEKCDYLILESTYGDRLHESRENRIDQLGKLLTKALNDKGKVFIPAFSLGRTQELIYEMDRLFSDPHYKIKFPDLKTKNQIPVFIDSPLGIEITNIYSSLSEYWDKEAKNLLKSGDHPIDFDHLYAVKNHKEHKKLLNIDGPAIIIAGSGMCSGGRIVDHLQSEIETPENDILFVGYQSPGTLGYEILQTAQKPGNRIFIDEESLTVKAKIHKLTGYSAHADQNELILWVSSFQEKPKSIKLVHGSSKAQKALAKKLQSKNYELYE